LQPTGGVGHLVLDFDAYFPEQLSGVGSLALSTSHTGFQRFVLLNEISVLTAQSSYCFFLLSNRPVLIGYSLFKGGKSSVCLIQFGYQFGTVCKTSTGEKGNKAKPNDHSGYRRHADSIKPKNAPSVVLQPLELSLRRS